MSDWLERELARGLAPVAAPEALRIRLGLARARRREFPRVALAMAAAIVMIIGAGYAAGRTAALDLRREAARRCCPATVRRRTARRRPPLRCDGGAASPVRVNSGRATVLLAHTPTFRAPRSSHRRAADAGCHLCHNL